jgi:signal transduction histidine kinase
MKGGRYILFISIPLLAGLFCLLGWNCLKMYRFEKKQIADKVEAAVAAAAYQVQWYNGSLVNNYALMLTDSDFHSKLAFAAGFTHNKSKMSMMFFDEDSVPKSPGADTNIISRAFLEKNKISFKPSRVMTIGQFDSLLRIGLTKGGVAVPYKIVRSKQTDSAETKDIIVSSQFIIDFFEPRMYTIHYNIPGGFVFRDLLPYLGSNLLVCLLLISSTVFYYRGYRLQVQTSQFRESLFGNVTHELKTPLTSMQLIVDGAKKSISDSATVTVPSKHILFAENELSRMKLIVDRILSLSKMSREQFTFDKERTDLDQVISEAIKVMEINTQQAKGVINYEAGNRVTILGDPILLVNAVSALIDNAIKYTNGDPELTISLAKDAQFAVITIADNGIGIPKGIGKKIFEPFFRVPAGNVYNTPGHGLGLSFVQQVMKLHGGTAGFESGETGSVFYLKFKIS